MVTTLSTCAAIVRKSWALLVLACALWNPVNAAQPVQESLRLSQFSPQPGPARLSDVANGIDLFVPLSSAVRLTDSVVDLRFSHSIALQGGRSYLMVRFNETSLAQVAYRPDQPLASARIRLPAELWRDGFNKLTLAVVQHYADRCEDPEAPELWTEIDLHASTLTYTLEPTERPLTLRDLGGLFAPGLGGLERVLVMTAPDDSADAEAIRSTALPMVAQGLALRRQFAQLQFDHARWDATQAKGNAGAFYLPAAHAGATHVLVGTAAELASLVAPADLAAIAGPHLSISRLPAVTGANDRVTVPPATRLLVTGRNAAEVVAASRTLAEMDDGLNPIDKMSVLDRAMETDGLPLVHGRVLQGGRTYTFAAAGTPTTTMEGFGAQRVLVNLAIPADYYTSEAAKAELLLDFGYGAGMGPGSVMNVMLNGEYIHGLLFDAPSGAAFRGYRIALPVRRLVPGLNTLDFAISLRPQQVGAECAGIKGRHLVAQIMGTSTITLPEAGAVAIQPNLALFGATGFPYIAPGHVEAGTLAVSSADQIGGALTIVGKLAQVAGAPQEGWRLIVGLDKTALGGRAIVLSTPDALPDDLFASWSGAVGRTVRWPYRALNDMREVSTGSIIDTALGRPQTTGMPMGARLRGTVAQDGGLGPMGALAAFRNPYGKEAATLTLITAATPQLLDARIGDLVSPQVWGQARGDLMVWQGIENSVVTMRVADHFEIGDHDSWLLLRLLLSNNPWYWVGGVLLAALIMAVTSRILLGRRRARLEKGA